MIHLRTWIVQIGISIWFQIFIPFDKTAFHSQERARSSRPSDITRWFNCAQMTSNRSHLIAQFEENHTIRKKVLNSSKVNNKF